jgi:hypothetical protein
MEDFNFKKAKQQLLEGELSSRDTLIRYFNNYPKSQTLAIRIADNLGEALTDEVVKDILALADGYSFETPKR